MKIGLFIPCYVDQFYPNVGIATLELLEKLKLDVEYPLAQQCCGQPMANAGFEHITGTFRSNFISNFSIFDYIVCPSGSCAFHIKQHLLNHENTGDEKLIPKVKELTEFLTDVVNTDSLKPRFPFKVGIHQSCHGQRGLGLSQMSEKVAPYFSKIEVLLKRVEGLSLVSLNRVDECCGFGGTFSVTEEAVSVKMGKDRIADHLNSGADYITAADMSCLMHLEGILKRQRLNIRTVHLAEILNAV